MLPWIFPIKDIYILSLIISLRVDTNCGHCLVKEDKTLLRFFFSLFQFYWDTIDIQHKFKVYIIMT